ncbi:MAG: hypothetical protein PHF31_05245 [Methylobacter sp.]|nr:hypothetical protein [Methylobacter sp.]
MMASYLKYKSLTAQIRDAERQVLNRRRGVGVSAATLVRKIHQQMTSPATLLLAGGIGFIIGELTKCQPTNSRGTANKPRAAKASPLTTALNLITSVRTLYMALPIAWMMKSFHQPGAVRSSARTAIPSGSGADSAKTNI